MKLAPELQATRVVNPSPRQPINRKESCGQQPRPAVQTAPHVQCARQVPGIIDAIVGCAQTAEFIAVVVWDATSQGLFTWS